MNSHQQHVNSNVPDQDSQRLEKPLAVLFRQGPLRSAPSTPPLPPEQESDQKPACFDSGIDFIRQGKPAKVGLLTSESPDSVKAWRGRRRDKPYGKPKLAGDSRQRVLVMPPVHALWANWLESSLKVSQSMTMDSESDTAESAKMKFRPKVLHARPTGLERIPRSTYTWEITES